MTLSGAGAKNPQINRHISTGLRALRNQDRRKLSIGDECRVTGSIAIEIVLITTYPNRKPWDYGVGIQVASIRDRMMWIEIHDANSGHVQDIIDKLATLQEWLRGNPDFQTMTNRSPNDKKFIWVASGAVNIRPGSPQSNRIRLAGITFVGKHYIIS